MITVYGADWCDDTQRSLRHLRRLHVPHVYLNVDDDLDALKRALELGGRRRRTPVVDLGVGGDALVEPSNDTLTGALVEIAMLTSDDVLDRMLVQNVGDVERIVRGTLAVFLAAAAGVAPRGVRWPFALAGLYAAGTSVTGWCPAYHYARVTSLGGPGDRPAEAERATWLLRLLPVATEASAS